MAISRTTRTHLIYQFIILTLLFLGIGYNELLPDRKFVLFLAFIPMFCYQLVILSCCAELLPVPRWMNLNEPISKQIKLKLEKSDSSLTSPVSSPKISPETQTKPSVSDFVDMTERIPCQRRWEKSVMNLGASPKLLACPQKSKSWMNLSDTAKSGERTLSREGSLDALASISSRKLGKVLRTDKKNYREERANKAKSWKPTVTEFDTPDCKDSLLQQTTASCEERPKPPLPSSTAVEQESELSKSYSFPFRQKRLETWLEMKETKIKESNQSLDMPYWQTVGYNLAVKYEARRRRRAISNPTKPDPTNEIPLQHILQKSVEIPSDCVNIKPSQKKTVKSSSNCINKIKVSFSNLISKKKDEGSDSSNIFNSCKTVKPPISLKIRSRNLLCQTKKQENPVPEFPQFLSNERPLIFYPKYIPFEKERFESDVQKKMVELEEERNLQSSQPA